MGLVAEYAIEDEDAANGEEHRANDGNDPVYGGEVAGPAEPEEGNREGKGTDASWWKLFLRRDIPVLVEVAGLVFPFPKEVAWDGEAGGGNEDAEKGESGFALIKAVNFTEYNRVCFKPDVKDAVYEGDIEVHEENNRLEEAELEGSNEGFKYNILQRSVSVFIDQVKYRSYRS